MWRRRLVRIGELEDVWVAQAVLDEILDEALLTTPAETGGMLLGYEGASRPEPTITTIIGPGPNAKHRAYGFDPDSEWQQQELERVYAESGRITTYLGDWHTHPKGAVWPSRKDVRTARRIARHGEGRAPRPLMLIAGRREGEWVVVCFRLCRRRLMPVRLRTF